MVMRWACLLAGFALASPVAQGQNQAGQDFTPADFRRFSPQSALDMVREVPGFDIRRGNGQRGLGQANSNVLINGARPSGKTNNVFDALSRIPAGNVVRIELRDAASFGIPGLTGQVVNVVARTSGLSGIWEWNGRVRERLEPRLDRGEVSVSGERGAFSWTAGLESDAERYGNAGPEFITAADGRLIERRDEDFEGSVGDLEATFALNWAGEAGRSANVSASHARRNSNERLRGVRTPVEGSAFRRVFREGEDEWGSELSGDVSFPAAGRSIKLIGLYSHEDSRFSDTLVESDPSSGEPLRVSRFEQDFIENEAIGRIEIDWSAAPGHDWQLAGEMAYNRLDAGSSLFEPDAAGQLARARQATPTRVEEDRYVLGLTHSRPIAPDLSLQVSLSGEYSEISSTVGPDRQAQGFTRPKGYVALSYEQSGKYSASLRLEREVGQLSFFDFVSSQDLDRGEDRAGNRSLVPDQTWRLEAEIDRPLGAWGAATLRVFHEEIEDLIDQVPVGADGAVGPGNIDRARRSGAALTATLNLDPLGLEGLQFEFEGEAGYSRVDDPVTGRERWIGRDDVSSVFAELRWDIPGTPYALLVAADQARDAQAYRLDQTRISNSTHPFVWVQAEHKDLFGANGFVQIANLLDAEDFSRRVVFEPDRTGVIREIRELERDFGLFLVFGLSGTF